MNLVSNELIKRGWQVALVPINAGESDLITPVCEVFPLNRQWRGSPVSTLWTMAKFDRVVKTWNPDVLVLNCDLPELFGALVPFKKTLVVVEHSNMVWAERIRLGKLIRKILVIRKSTWVAVSSSLRIWPNRQIPAGILQNPLTPSVIQETIKSTSLELKRLVFIGRLSPEKQPIHMLDIAKRSGFEVEIVGDGSMRLELQKYADDQNLKVKFHGHLRDPWSFTKSGDLLVIPSSSEGDGLVLIEGMKKGLPVLLSDIPDLRRFDLPDRNYCQNVEDFVARILQYRRNLDSLKIPSEVSNKILTSRSLEVVGDSWEGFLMSL